MAKVRVYELAKEFGVESKAVMAKLQEMGEFVRSASSTIEAPVVRRLKEAFATQGPKQSQARKADGQVATAPPKVAQDGRSEPAPGRPAGTPRAPSPGQVAEEPVAPLAAGNGATSGSVTAAEPASPAPAPAPRLLPRDRPGPPRQAATARQPAAPAPQVPFSPPPARPGPSPAQQRGAPQPGQAARAGTGCSRSQAGPAWRAPRRGPRPGQQPLQPDRDRDGPGAPSRRAAPRPA